MRRTSRVACPQSTRPDKRMNIEKTIHARKWNQPGMGSPLQRRPLGGHRRENLERLEKPGHGGASPRTCEASGCFGKSRRIRPETMLQKVGSQAYLANLRPMHRPLDKSTLNASGFNAKDCERMAIAPLGKIAMIAPLRKRLRKRMAHAPV